MKFSCKKHRVTFWNLVNVEPRLAGDLKLRQEKLFDREIYRSGPELRYHVPRPRQSYRNKTSVGKNAGFQSTLCRFQIRRIRRFYKAFAQKHGKNYPEKLLGFLLGIFNMGFYKEAIYCRLDIFEPIYKENAWLKTRRNLRDKYQVFIYKQILVSCFPTYSKDRGIFWRLKTITGPLLYYLNI